MFGRLDCYFFVKFVHKIHRPLKTTSTNPSVHTCYTTWYLTVFYWCIVACSLRTQGVLPYISYMVMCCCEGYGFQALDRL